MKLLPEDKVGLLFFRRKCTDPDGIVVFESEAKKAVEHYQLWSKGNTEYGHVWSSADGRLVINLNDVSLVRYGDVEEETEEDEDEDNDDFGKLKYGYSPED